MRRRALLSGGSGDIDYSQDYFTMVVTTGGNITWTGSTTDNTLSYSKNNGATWTTANSGTTISVAAGDKVLWKGTPTPTTSSPYGIGTFSGDTAVRYSVEGNAMSLLYGDNFKNQTSLSGKNYALYGLFKRNTNVTSAKNLSLPATTLANHCYNYMFLNCTNLTTAPDLPATTLASNCYQQMFVKCTSLTTAPDLPATMLAQSCYNSMFANCTSLTTAPDLPATTLASNCYQSMFNCCTSLTTAPELSATTLANYCYSAMFYGCTSLNSIKCLATNISASYCTDAWMYGVASSGTFIKAASMTGWTTGNNGIPRGWTVIDTDDYVVMQTKESGTFTLTIGEDVSTSMLSSISYSIDIGSTWVTTNNTNGVKVIVTTPVIPANGIVLWKGVGTQMADALNITQESDVWKKCSVFSSTCRFDVFGNIMRLLDSSSSTLSGNSNFACLFLGSQVVSAKDLIMPASTLTARCYYNMFTQCTGLIDTPELPATTLADNCYRTMFGGCTSLTTAPSVLPATTLADNCYRTMFLRCTSLTKAPEISATTLAERCCQEMFFGCTALAVAPELPATTLAEYCYQWMFQQSGVVIAPNLPATTLEDYCYNGMFYNCTSLTTAPELPATMLAKDCYQTMFYGCTSLINVPELPARTLTPYCYFRMFYNCMSVNSITCLATDISADNCTTDWMYGVAQSGNFVKNYYTENWPIGTSGIPEGWIVRNYLEPVVLYPEDYDTPVSGYITSGGKWAKATSSGKQTWVFHDVTEFQGGTCNLYLGSVTGYYAFVKEIPTVAGSVQYASGWSNRATLSQDAIGIQIPSDAVYLCFYYHGSNGNMYPSKVEIYPQE